MFRNKSVSSHQFAMVPRADIPRSSFRMEKGLKTTFDAGYLVPVFVEEVLPGDTFNLRMTAFCRMATPIFPFMDNLHLESFFFFVPNRLVWTQWQQFMGEQANPTDSIDYTVPVNVPTAAYAIGSLADYMGLPGAGQVGAGYEHSVLPFRAYNLIWNTWFRDQNLQESRPVPIGVGPDNMSDYVLLRRGKRHDYFTSALPFVQKGDPVSLPLGSTAPVTITGAGDPTFDASAQTNQPLTASATGAVFYGVGGTPEAMTWSNPALSAVADLSAATAATINQLRQAFQIQKLLERDARGGTRYTEILRAHFGVVSPDARLQRPEYLGGGKTMVSVNPIAQTSATDVEGSTTPIGELGAFATALAGGHGFTQSFTEHGYVIGLVNVRADLTYQQGLRRHWSRQTRYDYYFPVFAMLGEQAILSKEIYLDGSSGDDDVFGYQERWAEYRYLPSEITGLFRSRATGTLDAWHLAQNFTARPTLNTTFIAEDPPIDRVVAIGEGADVAQFLCDCFFSVKAARPLPLYSVPGLVDHF